MQSVSSRIWTRVVVSIPYDDNNYTTSTSVNWYQFIYIIYNARCWLYPLQRAVWHKSASDGVAPALIYSEREQKKLKNRELKEKEGKG